MIATAGPGLMSLITVFVLAAFVGYEVISKVPSVLHTPLMSGTNAIHGIIIVGAMLILGQAHGAAQVSLGFVAVILATLNVVGGFVVTDRMLEMFKAKPAARKPAAEAADATATAAAPAAGPTAGPGGTGTGGGAGTAS